MYSTDFESWDFQTFFYGINVLRSNSSSSRVSGFSPAVRTMLNKNSCKCPFEKTMLLHHSIFCNGCLTKRIWKNPFTLEDFLMGAAVAGWNALRECEENPRKSAVCNVSEHGFNMHSTFIQYVRRELSYIIIRTYAHNYKHSQLPPYLINQIYIHLEVC